MQDFRVVNKYLNKRQAERLAFFLDKKYLCREFVIKMITSIYIRKHSYLVDNPLTLNFGGEYLYSFKEVGQSLIISRKKNEKYIRNFFNISGSECEVNLVSAIVGKNGVGKSSILDIIRSIFYNHKGFTHNEAVILVENEEKIKILCLNTSLKCYLVEGAVEEIERVNESYQSIYYSPHFDLKYNSNYDELDYYDISLDEYIKQDLNNIKQSDIQDIHNELNFKNALRIIEFITSDIFQQKEILSVFEIPRYEYASLIFKEKKIRKKRNEEIDFHNTPYQFREIIENILKKLNDDIERIRRLFKNPDKIDRIISMQHIYKKIVLKTILSVIIDMLEERNTYLEEGILENEESLDIKKSDAKSLFLFFIRNAYIKRMRNYKIFKDSLFEDFLNNIFNVIDSVSNESDISDFPYNSFSIKIKVENIKNLIELHREIVKNFIRYPNMISYKNINQYEFITIDPLGRSMSSGEFSILNFFSKLYFFLQNSPFISLSKKNYILLLDEADLGLHPMWKKRFIDIILKSVPYFFEGLTPKPNLQIILTTHDPLTLSDIPKHNVIFLEKAEEGKCRISSEVQKTFGAGVTDLLADSFFIKDGLIGDFAKSKINEVIMWINENRNKTKIDEEKLAYYKKVIELIDERVIKLKLSEMITELLPDNTFYNKVIDDEIKRLENLKKLKNDTNRYY